MFPYFCAMLFQFAADFLKHRLTAKTRHGTHSPFVYRLTDKVIYDFSVIKVHEKIEKQRKKVLNDDSYIEVTDLGAGSHLNKNRRRKVSDIARHALKSPRTAQLIYRLAKDRQPCKILELGTSLGITTAYLSAANPQVKVVTMEGCPETAKIAAAQFRELGLTNVELKTGNFDELLPAELALTGSPSPDFIYIDGNHTKEATLRYFNLCRQYAHEGTLLLFDDIYWSRGMKEAWEIIKSCPEVSVTVDLFWLGLVYFRKGQAKENFKIRF